MASIVNSNRHDYWDGEHGRVFPLMCPDTARPCHSLCAVWQDIRIKNGNWEYPNEDEIVSRLDGCSDGYCLKYEVRVRAD